MRLATVVCAVVVSGSMMLGSLGCNQADQERAHERAEQAKQEARKLGTEAEAKAKELNGKLGRSLDGRASGDGRDSGGTASSRTPEQKLDEAAAVARREGRAAGQKLDHAGMVAKVKAKLASDVGLSTVSGVSVDVRSGVVTLSGTVSSEDQKREAERAVSGVDGVTQVVNQLTIHP